LSQKIRKEERRKKKEAEKMYLDEMQLQQIPTHADKRKNENGKSKTANECKLVRKTHYKSTAKKT